MHSIRNIAAFRISSAVRTLISTELFEILKCQSHNQRKLFWLWVSTPHSFIHTKYLCVRVFVNEKHFEKWHFIQLLQFKALEFYANWWMFIYYTLCKNVSRIYDKKKTVHALYVCMDWNVRSEGKCFWLCDFHSLTVS